jgi:phenylalanyl-tRNA synthetase beta chain
MLLSYKWLSEFVELPAALSMQEIADQLTMGGIEAEQCTENLLFDDTIFEVKITPNRSDALSHIGIARELAALLQTRFYAPHSNIKESGGPINDVAQVSIHEKNVCLRYACRVIDGVQVKESSADIIMRLTALGIRPVNNVVDITNLILLERGQPMHAFDLMTLQKDRHRAVINVRHANIGETLTTLDGKERKLATDDVVIADAEAPIALAGVIGGKDTEITEKTTSVLLEAAYFNPSIIRKQARRHGLSTESSYRFERGTDPNIVLSALDRAAELIAQHSNGRIRREAIDIYPKPVAPLEIYVRKQKIAEVSGLLDADLDEAKIRSRFLLLGIETVGRRGDALIFRVPTFRPDLKREIDLIEEIMRLIGLDKVPSRLSFSRRLLASDYAESDKYVDKARESLIASGFFEAMNFSFGSLSDYNLFKTKESPDFIQVTNPLGEELSVMRQSLLPGLLKNVVLNASKGALGVHLFEIGNVFLGKNPYGKAPNIQSLQGKADQDAWSIEQLRLSGVSFGLLGIRSFDTKKKAGDFYDLKGVLEAMLVQLKISSGCMSDQMHFVHPKKPPVFLHPGVCAEIWMKPRKSKAEILLGIMGEIHPDVQAVFELDKPVYAFELSMDKLAVLAKEDEAVKPLPKFPEITRDIALLLDDDIAAGQLQKEILSDKAIKPFICDLRIFDVYKGPKIEQGKKSIAVSLTLRASDRTLTDDEIAGAMQSLIENLQKNLKALVR